MHPVKLAKPLPARAVHWVDDMKVCQATSLIENSRHKLGLEARAKTRSATLAKSIVVGLCLAGCSGDPGDPPTSSIAEEDGCDAIDLPPPDPSSGMQLSIDMELAPGEERQVCQLLLVDKKINLNYSEGLFTNGSHHALVFKTAYKGALPTQNLRGETVDASQIANCESATSDWSTTGVIAGGHAVGTSDTSANFPKGTLPDDVAFKIEQGDVIELNFHTNNASTAPVHACYKANLNGIPDEQVRSEAGLMFYYDPFITVPANGSSKATMACPVTEDVTLAGAVSHMHRRGASYTSSLLDGDPISGGKELQRLYETKDWEEPQAKLFQPGLSLKQGQWIQWSCDYVNPEARNVAQGQQTTDEMCMFVGAYWPRSPEMDNCGTQDNLGRFFGTGTMNGAELVDCWLNSPQVVTGGGPASADARYATQRCVTEACPNASARLNDWAQGKIDMTTVTCN